MLAAPVAATKFNRNHESVLLVTNNVQVGLLTPAVAPQMKALSWGSAEAHPEASLVPPDPAHQVYQSRAHQWFLFPILDLQGPLNESLESGGPSDHCSKHCHSTPQQWFYLVALYKALKGSPAMRFHLQN